MTLPPEAATPTAAATTGVTGPVVTTPDADTGDLMHDTVDCPLVPTDDDVVAVTRQDALDRLLWPCEECFVELVAIATDATGRPYHATLCLAVTRLATHRFVTVDVARARGADECRLCAKSVDECVGRNDGK